MRIDDFLASFNQDSPSSELNRAAKALWWDRTGNWDKAHQVCQEGSDPSGAHIHAYLHRKEGDLSNAAYWYHRAGESVEEGALEEEWTALVKRYLA